MHKRTIASMVAIVSLMLMASAVVPMLAADGQDAPMSGQKSAMPANDRFETAFQNVTGQRLDQNATMRLLQGLPDKDPLFAPLNNNSGNISGRYISFMVDPSNGTLQDYALNISGKSTPIFTSVVASDFKPTSWNVSGPLFTSMDDNLTMSAADNPLGTFHAAASDNASINLSMPAGFTVAPLPSLNSSVKAWTITGNGISAVMVVKDGTVRTNLGTSAGTAGYFDVSLAPEGALMFRALPIAGGFPLANERFLMSQLANWSLEGEMAIVTTANHTFWLATESGSLMPSVNSSQGMVTVDLTPRAQNGTNMTAPASGQRMWYVIAMDKNTVNPANGTVKVLVNGQQLSMANSTSELVTSNSMFWTYQGTNASVFVVPLSTSQRLGEHRSGGR